MASQPPDAASPNPSLGRTTRKPYHGSCTCGATRYIAFVTLPPTTDAAATAASNATRIRKCNCTSCHKMGFFHLRFPDASRDFMLLSPISSSSSTSSSQPASKDDKPPDETLGLDLKDYRFGPGKIRWLFCGTCGVRCFAFLGAWEVVEVDLGAMGVGPTTRFGERADSNAEGAAGKKVLTTVWRPKVGAWLERGSKAAATATAAAGDTGAVGGEGVVEPETASYLSVNAVTLEGPAVDSKAGDDDDDDGGMDLRQWTDKGWIVYLDERDCVGENRLGKPYPGGMY